MTEDDEIRRLFTKFLDGNCSAEEEDRLFNYLSFPENEALAKFLIISELEKDDDRQAELSPLEQEKLNKLLLKITTHKGKPGSR